MGMKFFICLFLLANVFADIPEFNSLDLEYQFGGNAYDEAALSEQIALHPDTEYLNLSGQNVSSSLMSLVHDKLPQLKELVLHGSIKKFGETETIQWQEVNAGMLGNLLKGDSSIEILDLSLSTVNDFGLEIIGRGAPGLSKINLRGARDVTELGLRRLIEHTPNIQEIDIGKVAISYPDGRKEEIGPRVSPVFIQRLKDRGIRV